MTAPADLIAPKGWLHELEPLAARCLDRHLSMADEWFPHQYVPFGQGADFDGPMGGTAWTRDQCTLPPAVSTSLVLNLLTEDNLPSYHHEILGSFGPDGAWSTWVRRWTAEEDRHSAALRAYLHTTRAADPVAVERDRMRLLSTGWVLDLPRGLPSLAYVTLQELATRVAHRNTGRASQDPVCERLLARIAADENLHMLFYREVYQGALDAMPDSAMWSLWETVRAFRMPGHAVAGFERMSGPVALAGIYNVQIHRDDVLLPVLKSLNVWNRTDFGPEGRRCLDELGRYVDELDLTVRTFDERRQELLSRPAVAARLFGTGAAEVPRQARADSALSSSFAVGG